MPLSPFPVTGKICASDGSTGFPDVEVKLINTTRYYYSTYTTESDGSFSFDLANIGGYVSGDSLKIESSLGSFYVSSTGTVSGDGWNAGNLTLSSSQLPLRIINFNQIKEEIIIFLRNVVADPKNRLSAKTDLFTGNGSKVKFELTESTGKNIFYIKVGDTIMTPYTDYFVDYKDSSTLNNPVVYFITPPSNGTLIEVRYNYGNSSWIYSDYPRTNLTLEDYPRVKVDIISSRTEELGLGSSSNTSDMLIEIIVWSSGVNQTDNLIKEIRDSLIKNKKKFHFFNLIIPNTIGPLLNAPERGGKLVQRNMDFIVKFKIEEVD